MDRSFAPPVAGTASDTIAAIATPPGTGGVGIIRVSGPRAIEIVASLAGRDPSEFPCRLMQLGAARGRDGQLLDQVFFVVMRGPASFTGEDVGEIHGHGGVVNVARLLREVLALGARLADAGEFSRRAFENGRMDLTRAEAILSVIEASSERALRQAQAQLRGALGHTLEALRGELLKVLAELEASIDFPDEGLELSELSQLQAAVESVSRDVAELVAGFEAGRAVAQGFTVALVGPVNAGKSSLLNALLGRERALVAEAPGTTRDYLEERVIWAGVEVTLIDTAGARAEAKGLEQQGIERGMARASEADLEVVLVAPDLAAAAQDRSSPGQQPDDRRRLLVASKSDLGARTGDSLLATSSRTGDGIAELKEAIVERVIGSAADSSGSAVVTTERQRVSLTAAIEALDTVALGMRSLPPEVLAIDLRRADAALAQCLGAVVDDEVLDELFSRFCIGK